MSQEKTSSQKKENKDMIPILKKECVLEALEAETKEDALQKMEAVLEKNGYLLNREVFHKDILAREQVFSTNVGYGIGLPHGKSRGVKAAGLCVARLTNPIDWSCGEDTASDVEESFLDPGDTEEEKVSLISMIAVNAGEENGSEIHLQLLAKLSRMMMHESFRTRLLTGSREDMYTSLTDALSRED